MTEPERKDASSVESVYEGRGLAVLGGRRRGRPSLVAGETSEGVCVKMPVSLYDRVYARASEARMTVPEYIRTTLSKI